MAGVGAVVMAMVVVVVTTIRGCGDVPTLVFVIVLVLRVGAHR